MLCWHFLGWASDEELLAHLVGQRHFLSCNDGSPVLRTV
jgi:hypothetical protein